jgi:hypothetical protein
MAINKIGDKQVINIVMVGKQEFADDYKKISSENNLVRCPSCNRLISKTSDSGCTIQHRGSTCILRSGQIDIKCTLCGSVIELEKK